MVPVTVNTPTGVSPEFTLISKQSVRQRENQLLQGP